MPSRDVCVIWGRDLERARETAERVARSVASHGITCTVSVEGKAPVSYSALSPWRGHLFIDVITEDEAVRRNGGGGLRVVREGQ
jgi:hypothetical protein